MITQEELIVRCKRGDRAAFTGLYKLHATEVYNTIIRLVIHTAEAEDILQESFVAAFTGIGVFKETGAFRAWIKRIAINKSIDCIRKRKVRFVELEPASLMMEEDIVDEFAFEYRIETVNSAIETLPVGYRTIFNLFVVEGIPQAEIAQMLGLEHTTVRTQYHRAKHKILDILKKRGCYEG